jgi:hypothetical protein
LQAPAEHAARPLAPRIASTGGSASKSKKVQIPGGGENDNNIDILTYICIHKFHKSNFHIPVRAQAAAARAVPGRDLAGKKVHEDDVLQDDDDEEEEVMVHKRQDRKRKLELIPSGISLFQDESSYFSQD